MKVDSQTGKVGLIGHPIGHSKSPEMMNRAFESLNLPCVYLAFDVPPERLASAVNGLRALGFRGWNVTIPHKVTVREWLDDLDESAETVGAVNTVVNDEGKLIGYNTDGEGYLRSLTEETGLDLSSQRVVLLGAGGAARAVGVALAASGARKITVANRTVSKAEVLADRLSRWTDVDAIPLEGLEPVVRKASLLVNTTSVGMHPRGGDIPLDPSVLHGDLTVSDLVYHPKETRLLKEARQRGARVHHGTGMLVHQAAIAFEHWMGRPAPVEVMRTSLEEALPGV